MFDRDFVTNLEDLPEIVEFKIYNFEGAHDSPNRIDFNQVRFEQVTLYGSRLVIVGKNIGFNHSELVNSYKENRRPNFLAGVLNYHPEDTARERSMRHFPSNIIGSGQNEKLIMTFVYKGEPAEYQFGHYYTGYINTDLIKDVLFGKDPKNTQKTAEIVIDFYQNILKIGFPEKFI